jgi:hypothetical protein
MKEPLIFDLEGTTADAKDSLIIKDALLRHLNGEQEAFRQRISEQLSEQEKRDYLGKFIDAKRMQNISLIGGDIVSAKKYELQAGLYRILSKK